jgi:hypothetical protein
MQQWQVRVFHKRVPSFDPHEWCLKNGLHSGGLNPGPLGHVFSALTTRPRLLAFLKDIMFLFIIPWLLGSHFASPIWFIITEFYNTKLAVYIIKEFVQPKMSLNSRTFLIWKEREWGWKRERGGVQAGGKVSRQAYLRLG